MVSYHLLPAMKLTPEAPNTLGGHQQVPGLMFLYIFTSFYVGIFVSSWEEMAYFGIVFAIGSYIIFELFVYTRLILCALLVNLFAPLAWF